MRTTVAGRAETEEGHEVMTIEVLRPISQRSLPTPRSARTRPAGRSPSGRLRTTASASGTRSAAPRRSPTRWCSAPSPTEGGWSQAAPSSPSRPAPEHAALTAIATAPTRCSLPSIPKSPSTWSSLHPSGPVVEGLRAAHSGNAVQLVVHVATTALPAYPGAVAGDWNGLQSHVGTTRELAQGFADARLLPREPPTYAFTPSALDPELAPLGRHTVYLACPCAPATVEGGWNQHGNSFAEVCRERRWRTSRTPEHRHRGSAHEAWGTPRADGPR